MTKSCIAIAIFFFTTRPLPLVLYVQINLRVYALNLTFQHALRATELPFLVLCPCRSSWISFIVIQRRIQNFQDHLHSYLYQEKFVTKSTPCTLRKTSMTGIWDWQNTTMISNTSSQYISRFSLLVAEYTRQLRQRPQLYKIPICVSETLKPTQEWELLPCDDRAPSCRSMSVFMKLRLSNIRLYMCNCENECIEERLQKIRNFFFEMVEALQEQGATKSIQVNLPDCDFAEEHWEQLFQVVEPLTQLRKTCDILLLACQLDFVQEFCSYEKSREWKPNISTYAVARASGINIIESELDLLLHLWGLSRKLAKGQPLPASGTPKSTIS